MPHFAHIGVALQPGLPLFYPQAQGFVKIPERNAARRLGAVGSRQGEGQNGLFPGLYLQLLPVRAKKLHGHHTPGSHGHLAVVAVNTLQVARHEVVQVVCIGINPEHSYLHAAAIVVAGRIDDTVGWQRYFSTIAQADSASACSRNLVSVGAWYEAYADDVAGIGPGEKAGGAWEVTGSLRLYEGTCGIEGYVAEKKQP